MHPYIRRRNGLEPVTYDHPVMERSLAKTLGIPLFQEQLMQLAVDVAGFDAGEADQLRRAMGAKRSTPEDGEAEGPALRRDAGPARHHRRRPPTGIYERLLAFANFGFAESHALSFAALVFYSSWLKLHHPAAFCAALLQRPADGFLLAAVAGRRRPPARGDGAPPRRQHLRRAGRSRAGSGRPAGGPAGARRDPHASATSSRSRSSPPAPGRRLRAARPAHQGGHPDRRAGRGAGHRGCARR